MDKHIRVISFDLDDTLWPITAVINNAQRVFEQWIAEHYAQFALDDLMAVVSEKQEIVRQSPGGHCLTHIRKESLRLALIELGEDAAQSKAAANAAFSAFHTERNNVTPFEGITALLSRLKSEFRLVSVTNGNVDLEQTPLKGFFDLSLNPEVVGTRKPDVRMFLEICAHFEVEPGQVLHVGDHYEEDVLGAQSAGLKALWVVHMGELESFWSTRKARVRRWLEAHDASPQVPQVSCVPSLGAYLESLM